MSRITPKGIHRKGLELWQSGEVEWLPGGLYESSYDDRYGVNSPRVSRHGNVKPDRIASVCSVGMIEYVIGGLGLDRDEADRLYNETIDLLAPAIRSWDKASEKLKAAYKEYVAEVQQGVKSFQDRWQNDLADDVKERLEDRYYDIDVPEFNVTGVKVEFVIEPLSFEEWEQSDDRYDRYGGGDDLADLSGETLVIEFNDSFADKDDVLQVFKKAAYSR